MIKIIRKSTFKVFIQTFGTNVKMEFLFIKLFTNIRSSAADNFNDAIIHRFSQFFIMDVGIDLAASSIAFQIASFDVNCHPFASSRCLMMAHKCSM